ncbi:MAG: LPS assembly lipoprotein LptE [Burkholderiales bacterium]
MTRPSARAIRAARRLTILSAALLMTACGFKLRGAVDLPFETVYVEGMQYSQFTGQLKRDMASGSRTRIADSPKEAQAVLQLISEAQDRTILAVSGGGRVRELQLRYRLNFRVYNNRGENWLAPTEVLIMRDMTYDDSQVLAKEGEAQALFKEMQSDAVQQVLRRVQAIRAASKEDNE